MLIYSHKCLSSVFGLQILVIQFIVHALLAPILPAESNLFCTSPYLSTYGSNEIYSCCWFIGYHDKIMGRKMEKVTYSICLHMQNI